MDVPFDDAACLAAEVDAATLLRAHRVQAALHAGVSTVPLERLGEDSATLAPGRP